MAELKTFPVYGEQGKQVGTLRAAARFLDDRTEKTIRLTDGREFAVPADALEVRSDGSFYLTRKIPVPVEPPADSRASDSQAAGPQVVGPTAASPDGVAEAMIPKETLFESGYDIQTVPIGVLVDGPVEERSEGDTIILPVVEEVWVIEKRQFLREEIRITRKKHPLDRARTIERNHTS